MPNRDDYARIEITRNGGTVDVLSPYHPDFPKRAREIRGRWDKDRRVWVFPATSEAHARDLCVLCFGTDKGQPTKAIPKRERKPRKGASKSKGLAAYGHGRPAGRASATRRGPGCARGRRADPRAPGARVVRTGASPSPSPGRPGGVHAMTYHLGTDYLCVFADRKGSYRIVDKTTERTVALVKCDRVDAADNDRGLQIATAIAVALNAAIPTERELQDNNALDVRGKAPPSLVALTAAKRLTRVTASGDEPSVVARGRAVQRIVR
jgi:hypothetical protein